MTDASPARKRARVSESQASNVVPPQVYRVRVTLPSWQGVRVFDIHETASFHEIHEAIAEAFDREPYAHLFEFHYPLPASVAERHGPNGRLTDKATMVFLCKACCLPTDGLKLPELKKALSDVKQSLERRKKSIFREIFQDDDDARGREKAFSVEDDTYPLGESYEVPSVGSNHTKLKDANLRPGDLVHYIWDLGSPWHHIVAIANTRNATAQDAEKGIQLIENNGYAEPPDWFYPPDGNWANVTGKVSEYK